MDRRTAPRLFATFAAALLVSAATRADQVTLQNGKVLTGEITAEDAQSVTLRASDASSAITFSRRISKAQIKSVSRPQQLGPGYVRIPVTGEIGRDATAASVQAGLAEAASAHPKYILLDIDSPGGSIAELIRILDTLAAAPRDPEIVAYVHNAYAAAAIIAMSCRQIYLVPNGVIGAAVPYKATKNGPVDVEAKFRSALEAKQRTYITAAGHDPLLLRGMMELDSEVYLTTDPAGRPALSPEGPGKQIKSKGTILTLTAAEAAECGLSHTATDLPDLGRQLAGGPWHEASHAPWDAAVATAAARQRAVRQAAEARDRATSVTFDLARPDVAANQRRLNDVVDKLNANASAVRDVRRQFDQDKAAAEADCDARSRGASSNQILIARGERDDHIRDLRRAAQAAIDKLNTEGDALQKEYTQLRTRQKALLASASPD